MFCVKWLRWRYMYIDVKYNLFHCMTKLKSYKNSDRVQVVWQLCTIVTGNPCCGHSLQYILYREHPSRKDTEAWQQELWMHVVMLTLTKRHLSKKDRIAWQFWVSFLLGGGGTTVYHNDVHGITFTYTFDLTHLDHITNRNCPFVTYHTT